MVPTLQKQKFLEYVDKTQLPESRVRAFEDHFRAIKRELERTGSWRDGLRVLDVGCGLGLYTEQFHLRGMKATGVDLDHDLIARGQQRAAERQFDINYDIGSSDDLPFAAGSFDVVFANNLLEHVPDWRKSIEEWIRVLAPGGLLWLTTNNVMHPRQPEFRFVPLYSWWPGFMKRLWVRLARRYPVLANYTQWPAIHWLSYFQLKRFFEQHGLEVRDRFDCMDPERIGRAKNLVRKLAISSTVGRWSAYFVVAQLVIVGRKPVARL